MKDKITELIDKIKDELDKLIGQKPQLVPIPIKDDKKGKKNKD